MTRVFAGILAAVLVCGCAHEVADSPAATESATPVAFNTAGAPTIEFTVPDMMCPEGCAVKTREILEELPGAKEVVVDFETKTATVAIEEGGFDADAALAALVDHGFENSELKPAAVR